MRSTAERVALGGLVVLLPPLVALVVLWASGTLTTSDAAGLAATARSTEIGLPVARAVRDLSALVCGGALILAAAVLPAASPAGAHRMTGLRARMLIVVAISGSIWVWAGLAALLFTYASVAEVDLLGQGGLRYLSSFMSSFEIGRALLLSTTLAAVVAIGALATRRTTTAGLLAVCYFVALWPLANTGHAAGGLNHELTVNAQMAHLVGITIWVGGLVALLIVRGSLGPDELTVVTRRFSVLAGWGASIVLVSGVLRSTQSIKTWSDLGTDYGILVLVKGAALTVLVAAGWWHRRRILPRLESQPHSAHRQFRLLATAEVTVMATTIGLGVALSSTAPPAARDASSVAESLLGHPIPPPLSVTTFFTEWRVDTLWATVALLSAGLYIIGVRRLRRRGDSWPMGRTVAWMLGCFLLLWATSGSPGAYGRVMFSMHMLQHMFIAIGAPAFLVLGAPVTLALRVLPNRRDGSRGPREWLLILVKSRPLAVLAHPGVAAALWVGSLAVFYSTSLFEASLRSHTVHLLMVLHFLLSGYLLTSAICGIDPGPRRVAHPYRVIVLMMTFGAHALFNVSLMSKTQVLAESWFAALDRPWGNNPLRDQYIGAQLGWVAGDYPIAILGGALIWSWVRSDMREAKRLDRQANRDGDLAHRRYNEYLARLNERT